MRTAACLVVALPLACPAAPAAPAPDTAAKAKERLEALKKRMPDVVAKWSGERWSRFPRLLHGRPPTGDGGGGTPRPDCPVAPTPARR